MKDVGCKHGIRVFECEDCYLPEYADYTQRCCGDPECDGCWPDRIDNDESEWCE